MGRGLTVVAAIAACLCGGVAPAQDAPAQDAPSQEAPSPRDPVSAMIGSWELSNADHDKVCRFVFHNDSVPGGYRVDIEKNCAALFPSTKTIAAWTVDTYGNLRLLDARGNVVIDLSEVESGIYDGFQPDEGRYILQAAAVHSAEDMVGDWALAHAVGKPICTLTLSNSAAAGADGLALKLKPGCDALVTRFNPTSWRMDNGELVLAARAQSWHFEASDANTWRRVPEAPDPLLLLRQ